MPTAAGVVVGVLLLALGMRNVHALVAYTLAAFVAGHDRAGVLQGHRRAAVDARRVAADGASCGSIARNRRRYGGYIVHAGIVMLFAAFAGLAFKKDHDVSSSRARRTTLVDPLGHRWRFVSQGVSTSEALNRYVTCDRARGLARRRARSEL